MSIEKMWLAIPPIQFSADGKKSGEVQLQDARGIRVGMKANAQSSSQQAQEFKVKRVIGNSVWLGPTGSGVDTRSDMTAFTLADGAFLFVNEQQKANVPKDDQSQASWEHEPINGRRTYEVDVRGEPYTKENPAPSLTEFIRNGAAQVVTEDVADPTNNRPLPVKLTGIQGDVVIEAENLNLQVQLEGQYDPIENPKPDSVGTVYHERGAVQDITKQTQRTTAKRGTEDVDTVSQDVSLHDQHGNAYTQTNPVPVTSQFEKFFPLIAASKWMELGVFDEIVPTYSNNDTRLTLAYKEDGALLGEAVMNLTSPLVWDMKLNRYINDDDGTQLLDDNDTALNLD